MSSPSFPSSRVQLLGSNPSLVEVQGQEKAAGPETLPHLPEKKTSFCTGDHIFLYMFHQWDMIVHQFTHQTCRIVKPTSYIFLESSKNMHVIEKICIVQIALVPTYWDVFSMAGLHSSVADHQTSEASSLHDVLGNVSLSWEPWLTCRQDIASTERYVPCQMRSSWQLWNIMRFPKMGGIVPQIIQVIGSF